MDVRKKNEGIRKGVSGHELSAHFETIPMSKNDPRLCGRPLPSILVDENKNDFLQTTGSNVDGFGLMKTRLIRELRVYSEGRRVPLIHENERINRYQAERKPFFVFNSVIYSTGT